MLLRTSVVLVLPMQISEMHFSPPTSPAQWRKIMHHQGVYKHQRSQHFHH